VLMEYTFTPIDFSERSHSQMRRDLFSAGPDQGSLSAADRVLCRQFASAHVVLGGNDPAQIPIMALALASGDAQPAIQDEGPPAKRAGVGSNPFIEFHAVKYKAMKAMTAPDRPLDEAERTDAENKIKAQWHALGEEGRKEAMGAEVRSQRWPFPAQVGLARP